MMRTFQKKPQAKKPPFALNGIDSRRLPASLVSRADGPSAQSGSVTGVAKPGGLIARTDPSS